LDSHVKLSDIQEAIRLFRVSTMTANAVDDNNHHQQQPGGTLSRTMMLSAAQMEYMESFLHSRLIRGNLVNRQRLLEEAVSQGHDAISVAQAIHAMIGRGDIQERNQGRFIKRIR
jgi:DNA replication licensing factor MCM5